MKAFSVVPPSYTRLYITHVCFLWFEFCNNVQCYYLSCIISFWLAFKCVVDSNGWITLSQLSYECLVFWFCILLLWTLNSQEFLNESSLETILLLNIRHNTQIFWDKIEIDVVFRRSFLAMEQFEVSKKFCCSVINFCQAVWGENFSMLLGFLSLPPMALMVARLELSISFVWGGVRLAFSNLLSQTYLLSFIRFWHNLMSRLCYNSSPKASF